MSEYWSEASRKWTEFYLKKFSDLIDVAVGKFRGAGNDRQFAVSLGV
jgi:hypothetical protein